MRPIRGSRITISITKAADAATVLSSAIAKFAAHDWHFDARRPWILRYPDGTPVQQLPEGNGVFRLDEYKEQVLKEYGRIILYITADGALLLVCILLPHLSIPCTVLW